MNKVTFHARACIFLILVFLIPNFSQAALFEKYQEEPILSYTGSNTFDQHQVRKPKVVEKDGMYYMYYSGVSTGNNIEIGLATSNDGIVWNRYSFDPIYACGENSVPGCGSNINWSSYRTGVIGATKDDGVYKMWYTGNAYNLRAPNHLGTQLQVTD